MKVLWLINSLLPEMASLIYKKQAVSCSNSWVIALLEAFKHDVDLTIAMLYDGHTLIEKEFDGYRCVAIPTKIKITKYNKKINSYLRIIKDKYKPEIIHVHGSEYPHAYNALEVFGSDRVVISIQGLISIIARFYINTLSFSDIFQNITLRNIIFHDSVWGQRIKFEKRGEYEQKALKCSKNVIGRTLWDKVHSESINPDLKYYHLDELIRADFYHSVKWSFQDCDKHTIFISQCSYPIKGLHIALRALEIVKRKFPDVKLKIAGKPFLNRDSIREKLSFSGYAKYILKLIKSLDLTNNIDFIGVLDANRMIDEYLKANVYICPSAIENSPNSMCEAQLLGVPSVLSFCGGVPDMTNFGESAYLYRFEEYEMLAYYICRVFSNDLEIEKKRIRGIEISENRHNPNKIIQDLLRIYKNISGE